MDAPRAVTIILLAAIALLAGLASGQDPPADATAIPGPGPPPVNPPLPAVTCLPSSCAPGYIFICNPLYYPGCNCNCVTFSPPGVCVPSLKTCPTPCPKGTLCRCIGTPTIPGTTLGGCKCGCLPPPCSDKLCLNKCPKGRVCQCAVGLNGCVCNCVLPGPTACPCLPQITCPVGFPTPPTTVSTCFCNINTLAAGQPCECGCNKM